MAASISCLWVFGAVNAVVVLSVMMRTSWSCMAETREAWVQSAFLMEWRPEGSLPLLSTRVIAVILCFPLDMRDLVA